MHYVGVDYHKRSSYVTVLDQAGKVVKEGRVANSKAALAAVLDGIEEGCAVLEAGRTWPVMYGWLEQLVGRVTLAHPGKVRIIAEAKVKTDRIDSLKLAQLLRADLVPAAYVPPRVTREQRRRLRQRMFFVRISTALKNRIHALVDRYPEQRAQAGDLSDLFGKAGRQWLARLSLRGLDKEILAEDLTLLAAVEALLERSKAWVKRLAREDERVKLLMSLPGFGEFLGLLVSVEIDDVSRFTSPDRLCAYAGLVPSTFGSGGYVRHGRIIKCANKWLRWACVEAVYPAIRKDPELAALYQRVKQGKEQRTNRAKVAVAKRLLTLAYRLLAEGRAYRPREEFKEAGMAPAAPSAP